MALVTRYFDHNLGPGYTGLVLGSTATVSFEDNSGAALVPAVVSLTERPAGSGAYVVTVTGFDESWNGREILSDGNGLYDINRFSATAASSSAGASLPATRLLTFEYETGTPPALTDVTGLPVLRDPTGLIGVRRADTGATVIPAIGPSYPVVMTRDSVGSYSYEVAENGYPLEYWVEYVVGGATRRQKFNSNPPLWHYATRADVEAEIGPDNAAVYANLNSLNPATEPGLSEIAARFEDVLAFADEIINAELGMNSYTIPLVAVAGSIPSWLTATLRTIAAKLASWQLGQGRDHTQVNPDAARKDLQNRYDWAMSRLEKLILSGLEGVVVGEADPEYTVAAPVAAGPTVDANGCALPPVYCGYPYGHRYYRVGCN